MKTKSLGDTVVAILGIIGIILAIIGIGLLLFQILKG